MGKVKRTERGWAGHYICADRCRFRRNTLLEYKKIKIVISTVGGFINEKEKRFETIGLNRYYETMAFHSKAEDIKYHDADVSREVSFKSKWAIDFIEGDYFADEMHEGVVKELTEKLLKGEIL